MRKSTHLGIVEKIVGQIVKVLARENDGGYEKTVHAERGEGEIGMTGNGGDDVVIGGNETGFGTEDVFGHAGYIVGYGNCGRF